MKVLPLRKGLNSAGDLRQESLKASLLGMPLDDSVKRKRMTSFSYRVAKGQEAKGEISGPKSIIIIIIC